MFGYFIFFLIIFPVLQNSILSQKTDLWWNDDWEYSQEIIISIDTSMFHAKNQPIDIRINFNNPCWGINEKDNSIRLVCFDSKEFIELESQVYDIEYSNENTISLCSLVFLIPDFADNKESYFVYYDGSKKDSVNYPDRVKITKEYYYYEYAPGQSVDLDYYKIKDEENCVYGIGIKGKMMTEYASNLIFRQRKDSNEFDIKNWDQMVGFVFQYDKKNGAVITTRYKLISNNIIVDGNLMIEFGIKSTNKDNTATTTNFYKYYHCPTDSKKISVDSKSSISSDIQIEEGIERDGTIVFLSAFKTKSESNFAMNIGEILPYFHVSSEDEVIKEYSVETNPKSRQEHKIIAVINDIDLGGNSWFSSDSGNTGKSHGIIFENTSVVKSGTSEENGIQVKGYEKLEASLPGLKAYSAGIYCGRNSFVNNKWDRNIPSDLTIEFRGELFTTEDQGYYIINEEAKIFNKLIKQRPLYDGSVTDEEDGVYHKLTIHVPFCLSIPLLSPISAFPLPITWVELYKNETLVSAGATSRSFIGMRIEFPNVSPGTYIVKVYKRLGEKSKFVAFREVVISREAKVFVFTKREVDFSLNIYDQNSNPISDVDIIIKNGNNIIERNTTDEDGKGLLKIPTSKDYSLQFFYKNIHVHEQDLSLVFSKEIHYEIELYDLIVRTRDKLNLAPGVIINPTVTNENMVETKRLFSDESMNNEFIFRKLPAGEYNIQIFYEGITDEIQHNLPPDGNTVSMVFTPIFTLDAKFYDSYGNNLPDKSVILTRESIDLKFTTDEKGYAKIEAPPGKYLLSVKNGEDDLIQQTIIDLKRNNELYLLTKEEPVYLNLILIFSIIIIGISIVIFILKKINLSTSLKFIAFALIIFSLVQPWWELNSQENDEEIVRFSKTYLIPQQIVTTTVARKYLEAEPANLPAEFSNFLFAIVFLLVVVSLLLFLSKLFSKNRKTMLSLDIISVFLLILTIGIFSYGFSELTKVGLGKIQDSGIVNILIPGTNEFMDISASWGFSLGVYLIVISIILISISVYYEKITL
jgi:hypothetical protein